MTSRGLTWPEAYYPKKDSYIKVAEALDVRNLNQREYRENPCYNRKEWYDSGYGIKLTPVDNSGNWMHQTDFFRSYDNQDDTWAKVVKNVGLGNSNAQYTNTAARVMTMISYLSSDIGKDAISIEQMKIVSIDNSLSTKDLNCADIIIHHEGRFHRRQTRIFVVDGPRKPTYDERDSTKQSIDNWFLDIKKYAPDTIAGWDVVRPLLMRDWNSYNNRTKSEISAFTDKLDQKEAVALVKELINLDQDSFQTELTHRLSNGDITSQSVCDLARELYSERMSKIALAPELMLHYQSEMIEHSVSDEDRVHQKIQRRTFGHIHSSPDMPLEELGSILVNLPLNPVILLHMRSAA